MGTTQNTKDIPEDGDMYVTLDMDDGSRIESRILTIFDSGDREYIALLPLDENGQDNAGGIVYLYRYHEDLQGNPSLENIESDQEYESAARSFESLLDETEGS